MADGPLLVFGPRSLEYDFGPRHPLSPRRFGPGIELLRAVGAEPGLAPEPAAEAELEWLHSAGYIAAVRRFSVDPSGEPEAGIGPGDDPPFEGMHGAAAAVAGGSIRAVEAILRGDAEHAYQPGGGLHHAMRSRASGFCIYNDVALAIARARREGLRVLYVDLDVHHGDGVQALHYSDPGVLTISFHESGRLLFPGTGFLDEIGEGTASGTAVNVPLEPGTGPDGWLAAVRAVVPPLAAAFGPDVVVSQHGADGHAWDPLAHLNLTTTAMGEAARLVDGIAHRYAGGRWFATGGGGYSVYRVVPRAWALTWLAGAHREVPARLPAAWRDRWAGDAERWDGGPLPEGFDDEADLPGEVSTSPAASLRAKETVGQVKTVMVPALLSLAESRGWWRFGGGTASTPTRAAPAAEAPPARRAAGSGASERATPTDLDGVDRLVALGVGPEWRRVGLATAMLRALVADRARGGRALVALHTVADRDPVDPLPRAVRRGVAEGLARAAGMTVTIAPRPISAIDPDARLAVALPPDAPVDLAQRIGEWLAGL